MIPSFQEWLVIREGGVIKTPVPSKSQKTGFTCGPAALRSILHYFGVTKSEEELKKLTKANEDEGTNTEELIKVARHFGLKTKVKYNMDKQHLKDWLDEDKPVIVCFQAWGSKKYYKTKESGHYAVVIGYDDKNVYFQDPSIHSKTRGYLPWDTFIKRWHDEDRDRYGIAMWKPGAKKKKEKLKKAKLIK